MPPQAPTAEVLAAAAALRHSSAGVSGASLMQEHEQQQMFRRLINPGIYRHNSKDVALSSLKTLSTIAENILREPENLKFQQFKPTNDTIKRRLIEPKGALEYAIALGFRPEVKDFQPYYMFNSRKMTDLRIENQKQDRQKRSKEEEKVAAAAVAHNACFFVKLAFLDDRKSKMLRDARERELRTAAAEAAGGSRSSSEAGGAPSLDSQDLPSRNTMPGAGHRLVLAEVDSDSTVDVPHDD
ncbi:hypothetical protein BU15DRAFT_84637 [Melanogaster broomeanus]|nr:hypothetical protein BU15DRAFT_84637 [Melanogaster broomeanus]